LLQLKLTLQFVTKAVENPAQAKLHAAFDIDQLNARIIV
jgi:hypothetical protein